MNAENSHKTVWNRAGTRSTRFILLGSQLGTNWGNDIAPVTRFTISGPLAAALNDLVRAAREKKRFLPINALRTRLALMVDDLIGVDRDLGLKTDGRPATAIETYQGADSKTQVFNGLRAWIASDLLPWAQREGLGDLAEQITPAVKIESLLTLNENRQFKPENGEPDYAIIIRDLAERLIDEELFEGLGPCQMIASADLRSNSVELTTQPIAKGDRWFSMVATLAIVTAPYAPSPMLRITAQKRNWATRVPRAKLNAPNRFKAYVFPPSDPVTGLSSRPCIPVWIKRDGQSWAFDDDFAAPLHFSKSTLPTDVVSAIKPAPQRGHWWIGLPELPTLYSRISSRTVFETDEKSLLDRVRELASGAVGDSISFESHKPPRRPKSLHSVIKPSDIGIAVQGFYEDESEDDGETQNEQDAATSPAKFAQFRQQNISVLKNLFGEHKPQLWVFGGSDKEQLYIKNISKALFGDLIDVRTEVLPEGTHGLLQDLEAGPKRRPALRFQSRVDAWAKCLNDPTTYFAKSTNAKYALICAPDEIRGIPEDQVNYFAGINAFSAKAANVHHCLPIDESEGGENRFFQRVQSALLDVLFAHSGIVLGVEPYLKVLYGENSPKFVHGFQVVRSLARAFSGEADVRFFLFTRLEAATGRTDVQFKHAGSQVPTQWMPLAEGLRWLSQQTQLPGKGGERWIKDNFNQSVKAWLSSINESDPRSLVLFDWTTTAGLWTGLRDKDLKAGAAPTLDGINLATAFPEMSFVRIRRGADTISLRSINEQLYEGWVEGETRTRTGELIVDNYATTTKGLVELNPNSKKGRSGHFIASMGYSQATLPRGMSCYRPTSRVARIKDQDDKYTGMFEPKVMEPAASDQSIPASLDVTVLACPNDVAPVSVAKAVMGLRLGYAHYGDWTSMPAPLFFRRKVEDYIIRYNPGSAEANDHADEGSSEALPPDREDAGPLNTPATVVVALHQAAHGEESTNELPVNASFDPGPVIPVSATDTAICDDAAEDTLLTDLSLHIPVAIYREHKRVYWQMLRGDVRATVELPPFASRRALFEKPLTPNMRTAKYWWQNLQKNTVVKATGRMIDPTTFWSWHYTKLKIPQSTWFLSSVLPIQFPGALNKPAVSIQRRFTEEMQERGLRVPSGAEYSKAVLTWAFDHNNDEDLGWLIYQSAQVPTVINPNDVAQIVTRILGVNTRQAIIYFIAVAKAGQTVIDNAKSPGSGRVQIEYANLYGAQPIERPSEAEDTEDAKATTFFEKQGASSDIQDNVTMIKNELIQSINALHPGTSEFESSLARVHSGLTQLKLLHSEQLERLAAAERDRAIEAEQEESKRLAHEAARVEAEQTAALLAEFNSRLAQLSSEISTHPLCDEVSDTPLKTVSASPVDALSDEHRLNLNSVESSFNLARSSYAAFGDSQAAAGAPGQSAAQRRAAFDAQTKGYDALALASSSLMQAILSAPSLFRVGGPTSDSPAQPDTQSESHSSSSAQDTVAVLPVAKSEPLPAPVSILDSAEITPTPAFIDDSLAPLLQAPESAHADAPAQTYSDSAPSTFAADIRTEDTEVEDTSDGADDTATSAISVLTILVSERRYSMASLQAEAMVSANLMPGFNYDAAVLLPLLSSLQAVDCRFEPNNQIDPALINALLEENIEGKYGATAEFKGACVLAAGLPFLLFGDLMHPDRGSILAFTQDKCQHIPAIESLVKALWEQAQKNIVLTREKLTMSQLSARDAFQSELKRMQTRAAHWCSDESMNETFWNKGVKAVNTEIYKPRSPIGAVLDAVARGNAKEATRLFEAAHKLFEKPALAMAEAAKRIDERSTLEGMYRQRVVDNINNTREFVQRYLDLTKKAESGVSDLTKTENAWIEELYSLLGESRSTLKTLEPKSPLDALFMECASTMLDALLRLYSDSVGGAYIPEQDQRLLIQLPLDETFTPAYKGENAVCSPRDVLAELTRLSNEPLNLGADANDESSLAAALLAAADAHLESHRFRPAIQILRQRGATTKWSERYRSARSELSTDLQQASLRVAQALSLGSITQTDQSAMDRVISAIEVAVRAEPPIGDPECAYVTYPDIPLARAALRKHVTSVLDESDARKRLDLKGKLEQHESAHPEQAPDIKKILALLNSQSATSIRAAEDAFLSLQRHGQALPTIDRSSNAIGKDYEVFISEVTHNAGRAFMDALQERLKGAPADADPAWLAALDKDHRKDALSLLTSWGEVTRSDGIDVSKVEAFFTKIGARIPPTLVITGAGYARTRQEFFWTEPPFVLPKPGMPPELGSLAREVRGYLIRGGDAESEIRQATASATSPTLVFARCRLSLDKRSELSNRQPVLLIDDYLIGYVAVNPDNRLRTLLEVALMTFAAKPYQDFGGQPVPPEMFYGRERELNQLRNVQTNGVLYGGRRLGKSSLLDQIRRDYLKRESQGHAAVYIPLAEPELSDGHVNWAWREVLKKLVGSNLIPPMPPGRNAGKDIVAYIESSLLSPDSKIRDLYLLIDEADRLMDQEFRRRPEDPSFVRMLHNLCENLGQVRIRYVLAGLHNLTRMSTESNSPLGKAQTISLEPYSSPEDVRRGIQLITEPLGTLGYVFAEDDLPWRIMSVCNFYPAFIQLYCETLLEWMQNRRQTKRPLTVITVSDLDHVDRDEKLLAVLQEKFALNLNLDMRYKAIALILADLYYSKGESQGLTVTEVRDYCQLMAPNHFGNTESGAYDALLDEMKKLNMLERVGPRYVLRNPNIAMMMGDHAKVQHDLDALGQAVPIQTRSPGERRVTVTNNGSSQIHFPMPVAWIRSKLDYAASDSQLLILIGNDQSGLSSLTIEQKDDWSLCDDSYLFSLKVFKTPQDIDKYLRKQTSFSKARLLAVFSSSWKVDQLEVYIGAAQRASKRNIRIVLLANHAQAKALAMKYHAEQKDKRWAIEHVPAWSDDALYLHIREKVDISDSDDARTRILSATGAFHSQVIDVCRSLTTTKKLADQCDKLRGALAPTLQVFHDQIGLTAIVNDPKELAAIAQCALLLNGVSRSNHEDLLVALDSAQAKEWGVKLLEWMGLLRQAPNGTWQVPEIYINAIEKSHQ